MIGWLLVIILSRRVMPTVSITTHLIATLPPALFIELSIDALFSDAHLSLLLGNSNGNC